MEWSKGENSLTFRNSEVKLPYPVEAVTVVNGLAIVLLATVKSRSFDDADIKIDSISNNVLGFDQDGSLRWVASVPPDVSADERQNTYCRSIHTIDGCIYLQYSNGRLYRLEPEGGTLPRSWPDTVLPLETDVELDGPLVAVIDTDERVYVMCGEADISLAAFEHTGAELWRSTDRRGRIFLENSTLYERVTRGPRTEDWYRLDKESGERIETVPYPL